MNWPYSNHTGELTKKQCDVLVPGGECHSTSEWMNLASFNRMYVFLKDLPGKI